MNVRDLMTTHPTSASSAESLASAAVKMWNEDCGILPVVDDGAVEGVITDRDIAMALAMRATSASQVLVGEVINGSVHACQPKDAITDALGTMREHRVRRLLVLDGGELVGLLSLNDVILESASGAGAQSKPTYTQVIKALKEICAHRQMLSKS